MFAVMGPTPIIFFGPELERIRINGDRSPVRFLIYRRASACCSPFEPDFSVRAVAYEKTSSLLSIRSLKQFWNAITLELRASLLVRGLRFRFLLMFVWFCMVCTKLYQISTVLRLHDHISTTTIKQYRTTITKTVPYYNYPSRVETVQCIRRYYCPFFLPAPRSNPCRARAVLHTRYTL